jgi:hypothetical protein
MSNMNLRGWPAVQQAALAITILSCAVLGLIIAAPISQNVCAAEDELQEWLLCELGEIWPKQSDDAHPEVAR